MVIIGQLLTWIHWISWTSTGYLGSLGYLGWSVSFQSEDSRMGPSDVSRAGADKYLFSSWLSRNVSRPVIFGAGSVPKSLVLKFYPRHCMVHRWSPSAWNQWCSLSDVMMFQIYVPRCSCWIMEYQNLQDLMTALKACTSEAQRNWEEHEVPGKWPANDSEWWTEDVRFVRAAG